MSVKLNTRHVGNVTVIDIAGRITLGEGSSWLRDAIENHVYGRRLAKSEYERDHHFIGWPTNGTPIMILLNLSEVNYIDSSGIGELVYGFEKVTVNGGECKLLNLAKRVKDLLQITKLYTVFDIHENEAGAIRSFGAGYVARHEPTSPHFHEEL